jgi:OmpA-OmpF porin, OOP family
MDKKNKKNINSILLAVALVLGLVSAGFVSAVGQTSASLVPRSYATGKKAKVKGVITGRNGDAMMVRDKHNTVTTALLANDTKVESPKALWWKNRRNVTNLVPGLWVEVKGKGNSQGQLIAHKVTFNNNAEYIAQAVNGGTAPLQTEQVQLADRQQKLEAQQTQMQSQQAEMMTVQQEMRARQVAMQGEQENLKQEQVRARQVTETLDKRVSELDDYDVRHSASISFATGVATLTPEAKLVLDDIATKAMGSQAYLIEVAGFADTTGSEAFNQHLSQQRAEAVVDYLGQAKGVPLRRMLNPTGMGISHPVAENSTAEGRALNRRAEVKILVNRALAQN